MTPRRSVSLILKRMAQILVFVACVIVLLKLLGVNTSTLLASLGISGIAIGYSMRDIVPNFLSGIFLMFWNLFEIGDTIKVAGCEGKVRAIEIRHTTLESNGEKFLIPNAKIWAGIVIVVENRRNKNETTIN